MVFIFIIHRYTIKMSNSTPYNYTPSPSAVLSGSPLFKKPRHTIRIIDRTKEDMQTIVAQFKKQMRIVCEQQTKNNIYQTYVRYITVNQHKLTADLVNDLQNSIITQAQNNHLTNDQEMNLLLLVENMFMKNLSIYHQLKYHITTSYFTVTGAKIMNDQLICHMVDSHITHEQKKELCSLIKLIPTKPKYELPLFQKQLDTVYTVNPQLIAEKNIIALLRITRDGINYFKIVYDCNGLTQLMQSVQTNYGDDVIIISVFSETYYDYMFFLYSKLINEFGSHELYPLPNILAKFVSFAIVSDVKYINCDYVVDDEYVFDDSNDKKKQPYRHISPWDAEFVPH